MEENERQSNRHTKKGIRPLTLVILLAILAAAVIIAVVAINGGRSEEPVPAEETPMPTATVDELSTPIGTIKLPQELAISCRLQDSSEDGQYSACFYTTVGKDEILLFELSMGADGNGYTLGSAPNKSGEQTAVWLNIHEIKKQAGWTDEEYSNLNKLQSHVNDLIEQITSLEGFQGGE
mgnify:CR=1 FL=1